ncbi:receptor-type tyrosine-protein phosphatase delta-like [Watersipora subatra]|uniref:receptor-type tyrosine-protein phosphatase delta-like n=1 Tax=Watersipora subatra TaxID=2589382 RepID=UPI00355C5B35
MNNFVNCTIYLCLTALILVCSTTGEDNSNEPYELTIIDIGTHSITVNWTDPIPIKSFQVTAEPYNGEGIQSNYSANGTLRNIHEYTFDNLTPYTNYTLAVQPVTSDPSVLDKQPVRATTLQYAPGKVSARGLIYSHDFITVQWAEPYTPNGVIQEYFIALKAQVVTYHQVSPTGEVTISTFVDFYNTTVNASVDRITIRDGIKPYTTYAVKIAAKTEYGWGDTADDELTTLATNPSGTPANFTHSDDITSYSAELYWQKIPLKERNGEIAGYRLRYMDRGKQHEVYTESREYRFGNLTQDTLHTFYLSGYVEENRGRRLLGPEAMLELTTLQSAPVPPVSEQLRKNWLVEESITSDQVTFKLTKNVQDIFPQGNGDITQYQILVIKEKSNDQQRKSGYTENMMKPLTWNEAKKKSFREPYAIAMPQPSPASWSTTINNRRTTSSQSEITIGSESCDSESQYCNGPLQALKTYWASVTQDGQKDSEGMESRELRSYVE